MTQSNEQLQIMEQRLQAVDKLARDAGDAIMVIYGREFSVEEKDDKSPLTEADKAAHSIIQQGLSALPGDVPILSEEDTSSFSGPNAQEQYWLVDPLDGTKEFIKRNGEFTVNIALVEQGRPVLGVVYAPALNLTYLAAKGIGAFKVDGQGDRKPIHAAPKPTDDAVWKVVGSRSHPSDELAAWLEKLGKHDMQPMGSSLKLCLVAEGKADVYPRLGPTSLWDTGAAQAVVEQAGGRVTQLDDTPLDYGNTSDVLNPHFIVWGAS